MKNIYHRSVAQTSESDPLCPISLRWRRIAVAGWASFLAACLGTVLMLSVPMLAGVAGIEGCGNAPTPMEFYSAWFLILWTAGAFASATTLYLVGTSDRSAAGRV